MCLHNGCSVRACVRARAQRLLNMQDFCISSTLVVYVVTRISAIAFLNAIYWLVFVSEVQCCLLKVFISHHQHSYMLCFINRVTIKVQLQLRSLWLEWDFNVWVKSSKIYDNLLSSYCQIDCHTFYWFSSSNYLVCENPRTEISVWPLKMQLEL